VKIPGVGNLPIRMVLTDFNIMLEQVVLDKTAWYLHQAEDFFDCTFKLAEIRFNLKGKTAGYFKQLANGRSIINYNSSLLELNGNAFIERTVPHEVAHLVAYQLYGSSIKPHGAEWLSVMQLFKADASRCHDYDMTNVATRTYRRFAYQCVCQTHYLTSIRHNRIQGGQRYYCRKCHQALSSSFA
jgi:SprT protein